MWSKMRATPLRDACSVDLVDGLIAQCHDQPDDRVVTRLTFSPRSEIP